MINLEKIYFKNYMLLLHLFIISITLIHMKIYEIMEVTRSFSSSLIL